MPTAVKELTGNGLRHEQTVERTSKPCVFSNPHRASLLQWLTYYPQMRRPDKAKMWFANVRWTQSELAEAHNAGFEALADALGYRQPLNVASQPIIVSITPDTGQALQIEPLAA